MSVSAVYAQTTSDIKLEPKFQIATNLGFAYRTAPLSDEISDDLKDYAKTLKSGYGLGIDLSYLIKPQWGVGVKFLQFNSVNTIYLNGTNPDGSSSREGIKDRVNIKFIGPTYISRLPLSNDSHVIIGSLGLGYMLYANSSDLMDESLKLSGDTFGSSLDFGYDYRLNKILHVGLQLGYTVGVLNEFKLEENNNSSTIQLEGDNRENLSFLNIGGGLRLSI